MNFKKQFKDGLLDKNPVFVQLLGMCSTLAITTTCSTVWAWALPLPSSPSAPTY